MFDKVITKVLYEEEEKKASVCRQVVGAALRCHLVFVPDKEIFINIPVWYLNLSEIMIPLLFPLRIKIRCGF